jgi:monofunctional biosynthetic peptidoglycan transglycosylase
MPAPPPDEIRVPDRRSRPDVPPDPNPPKEQADVARARRRKSPVRSVLLALVGLFVVLPLTLILLGRWVPIAVTSYMLQSPTQPVQHDWVPKEQIAEVARRAVVAAEDQKFWDHRGFDVEAMRSAYQRNRRGGRIRGGSTISQQTAKNLFLWPGGGYVRKGIEAGLTVAIEALWSKQRILEVYLNSAEFGPGVYGVEAAAQRYFGKPASQLTAFEAARLAAVLPNPRKWKVSAPGRYVQSRAAWIQRQMGYAGRPAPIEDAEPAPPPGEEINEDEDELRWSSEPAPAAENPAEPAPPPDPAAPAGQPLPEEPAGEPVPVPSP